MRVTSYGAAGTVTGSCHLVEMDERVLLIDCGMYQGLPELEARNYEPLGFDPHALDAILLTHAHLDHVGRLPLVTEGGFDGPIYTTRASYDAARLILIDSARIQYEDWSNRALDGARNLPPPLYSEQDVFEALDQFHPVSYNRSFKIGPLKVVFRDAGHVLGAAFIEIEGPSGRLTASGDIGLWNQQVVPPPRLPAPCDLLLLESTYGGQVHAPLDEGVARLRDRIKATYEAGGNVLIPTFALERAQDILFTLRTLDDQGQLPPVEAFLDSPMAINFTHLHRRYPDLLGAPVREVLDNGGDPFQWKGLTLTRTQAESRRIDMVKSGALIMAGSGMANAGRIVRHLASNLPRRESAVVFVGYQAEGTLGRELCDGAKEVQINGQTVPVRAHIEKIDGFSAHGDEPTLLQWAASAGQPKVILVHGESPAPEALQAALQQQGLEAVIAAWGKAVER